jgi:hypothetical protein
MNISGVHHPPAPAIQRPLLLLFACCLVAASILAALASMRIDRAPAYVPVSDSVGHVVVQRYYDAINHMLETGNPDELRNVVGPRMLEGEPPPAGWAGRDGLERHLAFVRAAVPHARIEPAAVFTRDATFIVQVAVRLDEPGAMLGFQIDGQTALWPATEELRVANGRVIERRVDWESLFRLESVQDLPFDSDPNRGIAVRVGIDNYAPGAEATFKSGDAPLLVRVLSGELSLSAAAPSSEDWKSSIEIPPSDTARDTEMQVGTIDVLSPADVAVAPPQSVVEAVNESDLAASVLRVAVPASLDTASEISGPHLRVKTEVLASVFLDDQGEGAMLSYGEAHLLPGGRLIVDPATKAIVVCASTSPQRCVTYTSGSERDGMVRVDQFADTGSVVAPMLILAREGERFVLLNAGPIPAAVWVLAITQPAGE